MASDTLRERKVAERQVRGAEKILPVKKKDIVYANTLSPGSAVHVRSCYENCVLGACGLGERGKPAEAVGKEAAVLLKKQTDSGACLDEWMADQILPFLAIARGRSEITVSEITKHCLTNIWVIEQFLPVRFSVDGREGNPGRIFVRPF